MKRLLKTILLVTFVVGFLTAPCSMVLARGKGDVGFSAGSGYYQVVDDRRKNGYTLNLSLNYSLDEKDVAGLYFEHLNIEKAGEVIETAGTPTDIHIKSDITVEIGQFRLMRTIIDRWLDVGVGVGAARIEIVSTPDAASYNTGKGGEEVMYGVGGELYDLGKGKELFVEPVVDILGRVTALDKLGKRSATKIYFDLGYRFLDNEDVDLAELVGLPDDATVLNDVIIDDLSGFFGNIGLSVDF